MYMTPSLPHKVWQLARSSAHFCSLNGSIKPGTKARKACPSKGASGSVRLPNNLKKLDACWKTWKVNVRHWLLKCFEFLKNRTDKSIKFKSWSLFMQMWRNRQEVASNTLEFGGQTRLNSSAKEHWRAPKRQKGNLEMTPSFWSHRAICTHARIPTLVKLCTQTRLVFLFTRRQQQQCFS